MKMKRWMAAAAVLGVIGAPGGSAAAGGPVQAPPGTPARPFLSPAEAAPFVPENYLGWSGLYAAPVADPWRPRAIETRWPDFVVGPDRSAAAGGPERTVAETGSDRSAAVGGSDQSGAAGGSDRSAAAAAGGSDRSAAAAAGGLGAGSARAGSDSASFAAALGADRGLGVGGSRRFASVQLAVNAAFAAGGTARRYIAILPGTYTGTVFIPAGSPPLTLYGIGRPGDVRLEFTVDATLTPAAWAALVNPDGRNYAEGDPAWPMFRTCATRTSANAGLCATVVWSQAAGLQLKGLTITNTLLDTVDRGTHQALALRTDADRTQLEDMRLIGRQDTFMANADDATRIARVFVRDTYIEGDTDFVFGRASAVFTRTHFHLVSTRKTSGGVIFAPNTAPLHPYGFLVTRSLITADDGYRAAPTGYLGRAWDQNAGSTGYLPGITPNGQLVIRDSVLGAGFNTATPWAPAATTSRPFTARVDAGRDLNDVNYNRLWEYANHGPSAAPAPAG